MGNTADSKPTSGPSNSNLIHLISLIVIIFIVIVVLLYVMVAHVGNNPDEVLVTKPPEDMVLTISDFPEEWNYDSNRCGSLPRNYTGLVDNYFTEFTFSDFYQPYNQHIVISSQAFIFNSTENATATYLEKSGYYASIADPIAVDTLGDEGNYYDMSSWEYEYYIIVYRKSNVLIEVQAYYSNVDFTISDLIEYAEIVEGRIN